MSRLTPAFVMAAALAAFPIVANAETAAEPPLSTAQTALFETPQLQNIDHPETLVYDYVQKGPDAFTDTASETIHEIHKDGGKLVLFNFLTGDHHVFFPSLDDFHGNPIIMVFLEHDVKQMKQSIGLAAAYFRDQIRQALVTNAQVSKATFTLDGKEVPAEKITLQPFATTDRLGKLPFVQHKTYTFLVSDKVPGGVAAISTDQPADAGNGVPEISTSLTFAGVKP